MARNIGSIGFVNPSRVLASDSVWIPCSFTTDGSNDPTLVDDAKGLLSIARSTNTYTITCKFTWAETLYIAPANAVGATVNIVPSSSGTAGTITLTASGAITSGRVDCMVLVTCRNQ